MPDNRTPEQRQSTMRAVRSRDTTTEMLVRREAHRLGYRFRLHRRDLPGTPDLVFASTKRVIFVHGCFWHLHQCRFGNPPKSKLRFWLPKLRGNRTRDERNQAALERAGWRVLTIWQCELHRPLWLTRKL